MTRTTRLVELEFEAFRGFANVQQIDLDADVVLVHGDNGTGKTSLADGLLWLFTGDLPRLAEAAQGLRKGQDPIVNRYRAPGPARVRLACALPDGRRVEFEREGRAGASNLTAWDGGKPVVDAMQLLGHAFGDLTYAQLSQAVRSWGILQQHYLLAALDSGVAMHQRLAEVVGLERVTKFADSASEVARRVASDRKRLMSVRDTLRKRSVSAAARLADVHTHQSEQGDEQQRIRTLVETAVLELPQGVTVRWPSSLDELAALQREVEGLAESAREVAAVVVAHERSHGEISDAVDEVERQLEQLRSRADQALLGAPVQVQLASAALELLGDTCPVCGQPIDASTVRHHLAELLERAEADQVAASKLREAIATTQSRLQASRLAEDQRARAEQQLRSALGRLQALQDAASWLGFEAPWLEPNAVSALAEDLSNIREQLREAYTTARRSTREEIVRISSEVEASDTELDRAEAELAELNLRYERASALDAAAHRSAERIVQRALERLGPSFAEVFDRLAPHPTFTELRASQDFFYGKNHVVPEVYDPTHKVSGNPALIFSEGQLNVVALSYFLGLALNAGEAALPFVVLDDPLQSMDVLSVLGFADLCRRLREHRQLIVTTHDRQFASLLNRKLAPREETARTVLHEFESWTANGPQIRSSDEPFADVVPLLGRRAS